METRDMLIRGLGDSVMRDLRIAAAEQGISVNQLARAVIERWTAERNKEMVFAKTPKGRTVVIATQNHGTHNQSGIVRYATHDGLILSGWTMIGSSKNKSLEDALLDSDNKIDSMGLI